MLPNMGGAGLSAQELHALRGQIVDIVCGSVFVFIGLAAAAIALVRRRSGARLFILLGIWSAIYGAMQLTQQQLMLLVSPHWLQQLAAPLNAAMTYLVDVAAALVFRELCLGLARQAAQLAALAHAAVAIAGIGFLFATGSRNELILYNNLLAACMLTLLMIVLTVPGLSKRYLVLPKRGVLAIGTLLFVIEALFINLLHPLGRPSPHIFDHLGFAIFLFSLGYSGLELIFANERRLLAIENELSIARDIQKAILPDRSPDLDHLRVFVTYRPITAVAGDFYDFIPVDRERLGVLVADVSGHGVPAALFSSMIKIAIESVEPCACDPKAVLSGLNRTLSCQLRGQLISAAYLWLDTGKQQALYSAAGHPPLLCWHQGQLESIESNGLLFGVTSEDGNYPVRSIPVVPGDRFLLYTDGMIEPENARGDSFGDAKLEEIVRQNRERPAAELSERLLSELRRWQPDPTQKDDITLLVVDVV